MAREKPVPQPRCPYCGERAALVPDSEVYRRSYGGHVWLCAPCEAWVGCHRNSKRMAPKGRLAKADLRALKITAHAAFDALWAAAMRLRGLSKAAARLAAYRWLAGELGIDVAHCHIGHFDEAQTSRVIAICSPSALRANRDVVIIPQECKKPVETLRISCAPCEFPGAPEPDAQPP